MNEKMAKLFLIVIIRDDIWLGNLNKLNSDHRIIAILLTLSAVGLLLEMIPTFLAIASAVTG